MVTETLPKFDIERELSDFDDYLRWGTEEELPKSESSRQNYGYTVKIFLEYCGDRAPSPELAKEFIRGLEQGNQPQSVNRHVWGLKAYFRFKGGKQLGIRGLRTQERLPRVPTFEEWDALVAMARRPFLDDRFPEYARKRASLELALLYIYGSSLRVTEGVTLLKEGIGDGYLKVMGKGGKEKFVPVEAPVLEALETYMNYYKPRGQYVFPGKVNGHMARRTAEGIVKAVAVRAGLPWVHVHTLRHTAGVHLRMLGASERDIQDVMGHANISTTKIYTRLAHEDLARRLPKRFANHNQGKLNMTESET